MKYLSTRDNSLKKSFNEILYQGLSKDGGLYLPVEWPTINIENLENITNIFFRGKRKMINKPMSKIFKNYELIAQQLKISLSARPSELSFEDYFRLVEYYEKFNKLS